tara:strand:+ start:104 stop:928 length:825 start_codon:yes stop_codon:yes gene_type:complete
MTGIFPGNILNIDYLPKKYRESMFFQVQSISHDITTTSWTTNIETFPRIRTFLKKEKNLYHRTNVFLSAKWAESNLFHKDMRRGVFGKFTVVGSQTWEGITASPNASPTRVRKDHAADQSHSPVIMECEAIVDVSNYSVKGIQQPYNISGGNQTWTTYENKQQKLDMGRITIPFTSHYVGNVTMDLVAGEKYYIIMDGYENFLILPKLNVVKSGISIGVLITHYLYLYPKYQEFYKEIESTTTDLSNKIKYIDNDLKEPAPIELGDYGIDYMPN